jgi:competence protein ComEA
LFSASLPPAWLIVVVTVALGVTIAATASAPRRPAALPTQAAKPTQVAKPTAKPAAKPSPAPKPAASNKPVPDPPVRDMTAAEEDTWATEAEVTTGQVCGAQCHPVPEITGTRRTWRQWNDSVVAMSALGVTATDAQLLTVKLYMTRYYGAVNVNTAGAAELSAVLGLSSKDAAAIVEYRKANGNFANVDALKKVEGIDATKIDDQVAALRFS